jgi:hypothetical protein
VKLDPGFLSDHFKSGQGSSLQKPANENAVPDVYVLSWRSLTMQANSLREFGVNFWCAETQVPLALVGSKCV